MAFYSNVVFPRILDFVMDNKDMRKIRAALLSEVSGNVFEIGLGTGLNLPHYPEGVTRITTADPNPGVNTIAQKRIAASPIEVESHVMSGEQVPMDDASFDAVVCTWTLCSIPDPMKALGEMRRILKPGGKFFFVEHGISPEGNVAKWQNRLNRYWRVIGDGCNLNRNHRELIQDAHFEITDLDNYYMDHGPKFASYLYQGVATKA